MLKKIHRHPAAEHCINVNDTSANGCQLISAWHVDKWYKTIYFS